MVNGNRQGDPWLCPEHFREIRRKGGVFIEEVDDAGRLVALEWRANAKQEASARSQRRQALPFSAVRPGEPSAIFGAEILDERGLIFDYSNERVPSQNPRSRRMKWPTLLAAANETFLFVHGYLDERREKVISVEETAQYVNTMRWVRQIWLDLLPGRPRQSGVKRHEVWLAGNDPLAVCVGSTTSIEHNGAKVVVPVRLWECRRVFEDTLHASHGGEYYRRWCATCNKEKNGRRAKEAIEKMAVRLAT